MKSEVLDISMNPMRNPTSNVDVNPEKGIVCCGDIPISACHVPVNGPAARQVIAPSSKHERMIAVMR